MAGNVGGYAQQRGRDKDRVAESEEAQAHRSEEAEGDTEEEVRRNCYQRENKDHPETNRQHYMRTTQSPL